MQGPRKGYAKSARGGGRGSYVPFCWHVYMGTIGEPVFCILQPFANRHRVAVCDCAFPDPIECITAARAVRPRSSTSIMRYMPLPWLLLGNILHFCLLWLRGKSPLNCFFPGSIAKGSSSKSGCQLHLPTSHANLSRVTSPANFSCQLVESYFTCQLLMPTCRELLHLLTSHANLSRVTSPAYFSCQLFGCYLILLKAQANLSGVTSLS